jgi:hypothetical protein
MDGGQDTFDKRQPTFTLLAEVEGAKRSGYLGDGITLLAREPTFKVLLFEGLGFLCALSPFPGSGIPQEQWLRKKGTGNKVKRQ